MEYLTIEEFEEKGGAKDASPKLFSKAKDKIDDLTFNRIVKEGFENLTQFQQEMIKSCMFDLVTLYIDNPEMLENGLNLASYSVGDISVSLGDANGSDWIFNAYKIPTAVYNNLKKTNLMRRGLC